MLVPEGGKTAKAPKVRLTDSAAYGTPGFSGFLRPLLNYEIFSGGSEQGEPARSSCYAPASWTQTRPLTWNAETPGPRKPAFLSHVPEAMRRQVAPSIGFLLDP
jgi:hypothetical protein